MRWTFGRHGSLDFSSGHAPGFGPVPAPRHDTQPRRRESRNVEVPEGEIQSWETAWIDLGGEG
jgi:hypothetical protein